MDKKVTQFLYEVWVDAKGLHMAKDCAFHMGDHYHDKYGNRVLIPTIDRQFLRGLPYPDMGEFVNHLSAIVNGTTIIEGGAIALKAEQIFYLVRATTDQVAQAYYEAYRGE